MTILVYSPAHHDAVSIAVAASLAGEIGVYDLTSANNVAAAIESVDLLTSTCSSSTKIGLRWEPLWMSLDDLERILNATAAAPDFLVVGAGINCGDVDIEILMPALRRLLPESQLLLEATSIDFALRAEALEADGVILVGHEAGGFISSSPAFILVQKAAEQLALPYWVRGGIGAETMAAAKLTGASGVVLCEQLWLTAESSLPESEKQAWRQFDGGETHAVACESVAYRYCTRIKQDRHRRLVEASTENRNALLDQLRSDRKGSRSGSPFVDRLIPLGQEIAFAHRLGDDCRSVATVLRQFKTRCDETIRKATADPPLAKASGVAGSHQIEYPVFQGPMTRVSDVAPFAASVASAGGMPFLALSLMRKAAVADLLEETAKQMGDQPWGVGILGFVPKTLRDEQLAEILKVRPPLAIIAGGRPSQAKDLEAQGIATYLHVPSPGLLRAFLKEGARRFIFEGQECGGHVGPRSSWTLWQSVVDVVEEEAIADPENLHIVFAGGIHDARSSALAATIATPLIQQGVKFGILMGTAYLFTEQAVSSGAILEDFQNQAVQCRDTALLMSGLGHATRVIPSPFAAEFSALRRRLIAEGKPTEEIREKLELLNIGRLRLASKGVTRPLDGQRGPLESVDLETQRQLGMYMIGEVATMRSGRCSIEELHESVTSGANAYLRERASLVSESNATTACVEPGEPLAIVGMGGLFPESATVAEFWRNILRGFDAVGEIPQDRWDIDAYYDDDRFKRDHVYSRLGAFLGEMPFDPLRYRMPPAVLRSVEPVQLYALEVARMALEDAGVERADFPRQKTAVIFAAAGTHDLGMGYAFRTALRHYLPKVTSLDDSQRHQVLDEMESHLPEWTEDSFAGFLLNVVAGRVANRFNLQGTNFTVDAACASSLAALQTAVGELRARRCDAALVGAVDATNNPFCYMSFAKTHALSPRGRSRPFDETADGIGLGEGVGAIVLKRLDDARRDGDRIYAVIRGVGSSSDGGSRSLTAPHPAGQRLALDRAYADAGVSPSEVGLIESHSTGTTVGDQVELTALTDLFIDGRSAPQATAIGSVKSMIGHAKTAAGLASLIKTTLAIKSKILPPTIGVTKINPVLARPDSPFHVSHKPQPWFVDSNHPLRRAGVSSFGFGGTNFHVVLEEFPGLDESVPDLAPRAVEPFVWSAADRTLLLKSLKATCALAETVARKSGSFSQLARSVCVDYRARIDSGRDDDRWRLAICASSFEDLRRKCDLVLQALDRENEEEIPEKIHPDIALGFAPPISQDEVAFLFPGQGSQRLDMFDQLLMQHQWAIKSFSDASSDVPPVDDCSLLAAMYPPATLDEETRLQQERRISDTRFAQPALAAVSHFACRLLGKFGIEPRVTAGHSFGEYTALCYAGVLDWCELPRLAAVRGAAVSAAGQDAPGSMAAVAIDGSAMEQWIAENQAEICIANYNASSQTVIAGATEAIEKVVAQLRSEQIKAKVLPVSAAFHTEHVASAGGVLSGHLASLAWNPSEVTTYSNVTAGRYPESSSGAQEILARHLTSPVKFAPMLRQMADDGVRLFIEAGPQSVLTNLGRQVLAGSGCDFIALDAGADQNVSLGRCLALAHAAGLRIQWDTWFSRRGLAYETAAAYRRRLETAPAVKKTDWIISTHGSRPAMNTAVSPQPSGQLTGTSGKAPVQPTESGEKSRKPLVTNGQSINVEKPPTDESSGDTARHRVRPQGWRRKTHSSFTSKPASMSVASSETNCEDNVVLRDSRAQSRYRAESSNLEQTENESMPANSAIHQFQATMRDWLRLQSLREESMQQFMEKQQEMMQVLYESAASPSSTNGSEKNRSSISDAPRSLHSPQRFNNGNGNRERLVNESVDQRNRSRESAGTVSRNSQNDAVSPVRTQPASPILAPQPSEPPKAAVPPATPAETVTTPTPSTTASEATASSEAPSTETFRADLLQTISEKTGYPPEMLGDDQALEADLGIDSIKTVEIFSSLTAYHAFLPGAEDDQEEMLSTFAQLKTIGDIINTYAERQSAAGGTKQKEAAPVAPPDPALATAGGTDEPAVERMELSTAELDPEKKKS